MPRTTGVAEIAREIESDRVERKESLSDRDKLRQAICAFANDLPGHGEPGYLLIGVTDDGRPSGLPITDELLRTLADLSLETFHQGYLARVVAAEVLAENQRTPQEQLASLRFFDPKRGVPTHAGVLLFGQDPQMFLPGAYLQFVRFAGRDRSAPVQDQKQIGGHLVAQLAQLDNLLPVQIRTARIAAAGLRHEDVPDYPLVALRELVLNALMHRVYEATNAPVRVYWFEDRVEIWSPGGPFGQVTRDNFERISDYRNPVVAEALKVLGYVEKFGTGIARTRTALQRNGNAPARFELEPTHVEVLVPARP